MKNCEKYIELISARIDNELTEAERAELEAHLNECPECRAAADAFDALSGAMRGDTVEPPADLISNVMTAVKVPKKARRRAARTWLAAAACLAVVLLSAGGLGLFSGEPTPQSIEARSAEDPASLLQGMLADGASDAPQEAANALTAAIETPDGEILPLTPETEAALIEALNLGAVPAEQTDAVSETVTAAADENFSYKLKLSTGEEIKISLTDTAVEIQRAEQTAAAPCSPEEFLALIN